MIALAGCREAQIGRRVARAIAALAGDSAVIARMEQEPWASATFWGARHHVRLHCRDESAACALADALSAADLPLPGHFVAEIEVASAADDRCQLIVTLLTIAEE